MVLSSPRLLLRCVMIAALCSFIACAGDSATGLGRDAGDDSGGGAVDRDGSSGSGGSGDSSTDGSGMGDSGTGGSGIGAVDAGTPIAMVDEDDASVSVNASDLCPSDPYKVHPGICGCGTPDTDSDLDDIADCFDGCPDDRLKTAPGLCGCGVVDDETDTDGDGVADCVDQCPDDADKTAPGLCGCGVVDDETDTDGDGVVDCLDQCPDEDDSIDEDADGIPDCIDPMVCDDGDTREVPCGLNGNGTQGRLCVDGQWQDSGECDDPDECVNGTACDDGNACTQSGSCQAGVCVGENPVVCTALDQCHDVGECDPGTGVCSNPEKMNGTSCDDGNACTQSDTCQAGSCEGASPVVCTAVDQCHDVGVCDPGTGVCSNPEKMNGTGCDDGNACTQSDSCQAGVCEGASPVVCTALDQCHDVGECDPGTGVCSNPEKMNGTGCDDGNACTQSDSCQAGVCEGASPVVCMALDQCHDVGVCDPGTGVCSNPEKMNGTSCDDGNACTQSDSCQAGVCEGASPVVCTALDQCHDVGVCDEQTGECSNPEKVNGTSCDDGNACTQSDTCQAGSCEGASPVVCTALDQCHDVGECDPGTGVCSNPAKVNGASCDDGNACTQSDTCQAGSCEGASPVVCTALDQCHDVGVCDPGSGECSNPEKVNGTSCDDGNACTQSDTCQAGSCEGASPVVCTALDQCHEAGVCDPGSGECSNPEKVDGTSCDDGNACTQSDTCQAGSCEGASPVVCTALDQCHEAGVCDPDSGECSNPEKMDGTSCDDGNACTQSDTCQAGSCEGASPVVCTALDQCHDVGVCDPGSGVCSNPEKANGSSCDDGNACTQSDTCQAGSCEGASPVVCTALDQCHEAGVCDPGSGECSNPEKMNGTSCDDGNACTQSDTCQAGSCEGASPVVCTALDQCHDVGVCDPGSGECSNPEKVNGTSCDDGNACTQSDTCQAGSCEGASPVVCTAQDQCHEAGVCDPGSGVCSNPAKVNGTSCDDGNACTQSDSCQAGSCEGASPVVCTAQDQCHEAGVCDPGSGECSNPEKVNGTSCDDGNACTQSDTCQAGSCEGASPVVCTALDQCHEVGVCDPGSGVCSNPAKANGASCDDGNACTQSDTCQAGSCEGASPVVCTAQDQCHEAGVCDPGSGVCSNPAKANGSSCNDGNACTQSDTCQAGSCEGASPVVCTAQDQCHEAGVCDPGSGVCSNPAKVNGTSCDDGNACTQSDTCQAGSCEGASPVVCTALDQCHEVGVCDPGSGVCSNPAKANGSSCDDGNACTQSDTCQAGSCEGASPVVCTALDQCHDVGVCDPGSGVCSNPAKVNGTSCDDGNACTQSDTCQAGSCEGASPVVCMALDQCHDAGVCDPGSGVCSNPEKVNGASCNDGNACTQTDTCQSGVCAGANPVICTNGDECNDPGACIPSTGLCGDPVPVLGSVVCDDGNACTQSDSCQVGVCVGANPVVCMAQDQCHDAGVCDPGSGVCSNPEKMNGASCNDGNACTQSDTCQAGSCEGADPVICGANECQDPGTCDQGSGQCSAPTPKEISLECGEGGVCFGGECCMPLGCEVYNECGEFEDGCGGTISCQGGFSFVPSNFDPAPINFCAVPDVTLECGTTTINTSNAIASMISGAGGLGFTSSVLSVQTQNNGSGLQVVVAALKSLTIPACSTLRLIGDKPVVLAVVGDVNVAGTINASSVGRTEQGAGGYTAVPSSGSICRDNGSSPPNGGGRNAPTGFTYGGGGGGGGFGSVGFKGGNGAPATSPNPGGAQSQLDYTGTPSLIPLRGGCPGGLGGPNNSSGAGGQGAYGGGAVQITAEGTVSVTGVIAATGGGGLGGAGGPTAVTSRAGGGGGSGGAVRIESAGPISYPGALRVHGGGGGGGGGWGTPSGQAGTNGTNGAVLNDTVATGGPGGPGGSSVNMFGTAGGNGARDCKSTGTGCTGAMSQSGSATAGVNNPESTGRHAGGGGGGTGLIVTAPNL